MAAASCPIVTVKQGRVCGRVVHIERKDAKAVFCYKSIRYAKPPLGKLRFMKPEAAESWSGILDGTNNGNIPMQNIESPIAEEPYFPQKHPPGEQTDLNEDCLHLSVYTTTTKEEKLLPVLFWIYGGSFQDGSERLYDGSALAGLHDVVVVIPNYRLNVFGFFSLGKNSSCPGNAGLWDQNMALQWVQKNIEAFGGNPKNVTIFGESAGSMSVHHHVLSTTSRGLFHKAISHSGQANARDFFCADNSATTKLLLKHLGIDDADEEIVLKKLQDLPADELLKANIAITDESMWRRKFIPCLDGEFVTGTPDQILSEDLPMLPYMIGCNNSEGKGSLGLCVFREKLLDGITEDTFKLCPFFPVSDEDLKEWKKFYNCDPSDERGLSKLYGQVVGDRIFLHPAVTSARRHSKFGTVYFYQACFQLKLFHDEKFGPSNGMKPSWCFCDHGDDVYMMMGLPFIPGELRCGGRFSREEEELSIKCMKYLTNFARNGDPNESVEVLWPRFNDDGEHLVIDHDISVGKNLADREVEYWKQYGGESRDNLEEPVMKKSRYPSSSEGT